VYYATRTAEPSDAVLAGLAGAALLPTLVRNDDAATAAVLLPLIDSANHLEEADSRIDYDPVQQCFELSIGPACLVPEDDGSASTPRQTQLYVSYGKKKDPELLLNYGFLPGVSTTTSPTTTTNGGGGGDDYRRRLAEAFLHRNKAVVA